jgi:uncharacterized protein (TIGR03067 family)
MSSLVFCVVLLGGPMSGLPGVPSVKVTPPLPPGSWQVVGFIAGPASAPPGEEEIKKLRVLITDKRLVVTGGEEKEEYAIVRIDASRQPGVIDLRDVARGRTYRGIYERQGKRLRLCVQFWITGNEKTSERPASFKEAHTANVFGPTLLLLEPQ